MLVLLLVVNTTDKLVRGDTGVAVIVPKLVCCQPPWEIHLEVIKPIEEGGFDGARDSEGNVVMSETAMRRNWPNWIVRMTKRFKDMCCCDGCGVPTKVQESLNLKRLNIMKSSRVK